MIWKPSSSAGMDGNLGDTKKHLNWVVEALQNASTENFSDPEKIKALIFDYATTNGRGQVLWPVRFALSGKDKSPDPFTLIYVFGKEESVKRLGGAIDKLS